MAEYNTAYLTTDFGEKYLSGKISVKKMLISLKEVTATMIDMIKHASTLEQVAQSIQKIIYKMKGIPGL